MNDVEIKSLIIAAIITPILWLWPLLIWIPDIWIK